MSDSAQPQGWATKPKDDPSVQALRAHLLENNGIKGLNIVGPKDIQEAVALFRRDGFVVVADVLTVSRQNFWPPGANKWFPRSLLWIPITKVIAAPIAIPLAALA